MATAMLCVDCSRRPRPKDGTRQRCWPCQQEYDRITQDEADEREERRCKRRWDDPKNMARYCKVYWWKGHLVGFETGIREVPDPDPESSWGFKALIYAPTSYVYITHEEDETKLPRVPQGKLVNLNEYVWNLEREWVRRFKGMVKQHFPCEPGHRMPTFE